MLKYRYVTCGMSYSKFFLRSLWTVDMLTMCYFLLRWINYEKNHKYKKTWLAYSHGVEKLSHSRTTKIKVPYVSVSYIWTIHSYIHPSSQTSGFKKVVTELCFVFIMHNSIYSFKLDTQTLINFLSTSKNEIMHFRCTLMGLRVLKPGNPVKYIITYPSTVQRGLNNYGS